MRHPPSYIQNPRGYAHVYGKAVNPSPKLQAYSPLERFLSLFPSFFPSQQAPLDLERAGFDDWAVINVEEGPLLGKKKKKITAWLNNSPFLDQLNPNFGLFFPQSAHMASKPLK